MRYIFATIISFCLCSLAYGQGTVGGKVFDGDRNELVAVPVYLLQRRDSGIVQTVLTDNEGCYRFEHVSKGSFFIRATMFGRNSPVKKIMMWNDSHITADLCISESVQLKDVAVVSTGTAVSGDTTTYIVNRFTSGSERNLKEVLDRLPNVSVDESSKSITANGKRVNRILLEGQDLFQGNTSIPLENISAEGVRKVEIIDNYSEYNIYEGFKTTNETVLNVGVDDKSKNHVKGEIEGCGGLLNKYNVRNSSLYIGKKSMLSGIMASNNTGNRMLTFQDIMLFSGGVGNLLSGENPMDELSKKMDTYSAFTNSRMDIARRENSMASLNFTSNPSRKVKMSISGIYGYDHCRSRKKNSYSYLSGLNYTEEAKEYSRQHNGLLNIKLAYMPHQNLNIIYSGNMLLAAQDKNSGNNVMEQNDIAFQTTPKTLYAKNSLLLAKRSGKNVLNLLLDYSISHYQELSVFESTYGYFLPSLSLDDSYEYDYKDRNNVYAAQLFYLHRISDSYYLRLALKGEEDKQYFTTQNRQSNPTVIYDNDSQIDYTTCYGDAMVGKDRGNLSFSLRLRYVLYRASTDIKRSFVRTNTNFLSPMLQVKYQFTPFHHLMVNYEYGKKKNAISNLMDGQWLKSYNQVEYSSADKLFTPSHKVSLSHLLSLQYAGLNFINMASYEEMKDPIVNSYCQEGYISRIEKKQGSREKLFTLMSSAEYKFLNFPLNVRYNVNYNHSYTPMYYSGTLYNAASNSLMLMLQLVTFYKKGFNGNLKWQISNHAYTGVPISNRLTTNNLTGQLAWQNDKIYAGIDARLSTYNLNHTNTKNMYYGFDIRYELAENIMLKLNGTDVMHLKGRRQMTGSSTSYYSINSLTWYMPGHIMVGISFKY